jgi:hypothetical protein
MAPSQSKLAWDVNAKSKNYNISVVSPPIPFFKNTPKEVAKIDLNKFDCHLDPSDKDSDIDVFQPQMGQIENSPPSTHHRRDLRKMSYNGLTKSSSGDSIGGTHIFSSNP